MTTKPQIRGVRLTVACQFPSYGARLSERWNLLPALAGPHTFSYTFRTGRPRVYCDDHAPLARHVRVTRDETNVVTGRRLVFEQHVPIESVIGTMRQIGARWLGRLGLPMIGDLIADPRVVPLQPGESDPHYSVQRVIGFGKQWVKYLLFDPFAWRTVEREEHHHANGSSIVAETQVIATGTARGSRRPGVMARMRALASRPGTPGEGAAAEAGIERLSAPRLDPFGRPRYNPDLVRWLSTETVDADPAVNGVSIDKPSEVVGEGGEVSEGPALGDALTADGGTIWSEPSVPEPVGVREDRIVTPLWFADPFWRDFHEEKTPLLRLRLAFTLALAGYPASNWSPKQVRTWGAAKDLRTAVWRDDPALAEEVEREAATYLTEARMVSAMSSRTGHSESVVMQLAEARRVSAVQESREEAGGLAYQSKERQR